jgi:ABC-2 type transport system permease protein
MIPISLFVLLFLELVVSFSGFFLKTVNGLTLNYAFLYGLLAGKLFPLNLLFENFYTNLFNPFAFNFYHPMQIYLGKYDTNQTLMVFAGGTVWCIILYFLAKLIFKLGLKRNEAVGL